MENAKASEEPKTSSTPTTGLTKKQRFKRDLFLYALLLPGLIYFLLFKYLPMWGVTIAFKNFSPFLDFWKCDWVVFEHFINFFQNPDFFSLLRNTLILAVYDIVFFFFFSCIFFLSLLE